MSKKPATKGLDPRSIRGSSIWTANVTSRRVTDRRASLNPCTSTTGGPGSLSQFGAATTRKDERYLQGSAAKEGHITIGPAPRPNHTLDPGRVCKRIHRGERGKIDREEVPAQGVPSKRTDGYLAKRVFDNG